MLSPTTKRIQRNRNAIITLHKLSESAQHQLIPSLKRDTIIAIVECAINIISCRVSLTNSQLRWMKEREKDLQSLISKNSSLSKRKEILQKGGYLKSILTPIIDSL